VATDEGEALVRIVRQLCSELRQARRPQHSEPGAGTFARRRGVQLPVGLSPAEEEFVRAMRQALAEVADAASDRTLDKERERAVEVALEGVGFVIWSELAMGAREKLQMLLPSFILLIVLPAVDQDDALAISERAKELARGIL
jgi:hypothetical protein